MFKSIRKHIPESHPVFDVLMIIVKAVSRSMARDVMLFAGGAGAKIFKGTMDNTKVFSKVREAAGL